MANNAYYFSHDSNAKDDPKCMLLIDQLGLEGYGIFWVLIEVLRDQPNYSYPLNLIPILARRYNTSTEKMMAVIRNYNLFDFNSENTFFSLSLNRRMNKIQLGIEQRRLAGIASAQKRLNQAIATDVERPLDECSTKKRKEKKRNEIKIKENISYLFDDFWDDYDKKVGDKTKLQKKWENLTEEERDKIKSYIPRYKIAQPDKKYRKNPETFLNNKSWNDEIISESTQKQTLQTNSVNSKWHR